MKISIIGATVLVFFVAVSSAYAADAFLKLGDIKGESAATSEGGTNANVETRANAGASFQSSEARENACEASCRSQYGGSGSAAFDACIRQCGAGSPAAGARTSDDAASGETDVSSGAGEAQKRVNKIDAITVKMRPVAVSAVEVRGWDPQKKQEFMATVKARAQLKSGQDLENFAKGILLTDENVEEISADEDSVQVRYRVPAKFLGLFETTLPVVVVATKVQGDLGAGVTVKFPWFRFLFGIPDEVSQSSLETDVHAAVIDDLDRDGALDIVVAARLYTAISNVLKTKHDTAKNSINNVR